MAIDNASSHPLTEAVGAPRSIGHTFGSFIEACRKAGITDDMELGSIEVGIARFGSGRIVAEIGEAGIEVREI
jgi:hypothetical protein